MTIVRRHRDPRRAIEVSGGVTLDTVAAYAPTGADYVSTSVITQSAPALGHRSRPHSRPEEALHAAVHRRREHADRHRALRRTELADHWRIATVAERTSDELALMIQQFLGFHGFSFDAQITGVAISSGVPASPPSCGR